MYLHQLQKVIQKQKEAIRNASPELRAKWAAESAAIAARVPPPTAHDLAHDKLRQMHRDGPPPETAR